MLTSNSIKELVPVVMKEGLLFPLNGCLHKNICIGCFWHVLLLLSLQDKLTFATECRHLAVEGAASVGMQKTDRRADAVYVELIGKAGSFALMHNENILD